MSFHSAVDRGQGIFRNQMTGRRIATERRKRAAAKVIGGRSTRPTLMKIHVVPQIRQRIIQMRIFISSLPRPPLLSTSGLPDG